MVICSHLWSWPTLKIMHGILNFLPFIYQLLESFIESHFVFLETTCSLYIPRKCHISLTKFVSPHTPYGRPTQPSPSSPTIKLITVLSLTVLDTLILNQHEWPIHFSTWIVYKNTPLAQVSTIPCPPCVTSQ